MRMSRRVFLKYCLGALAALVTACTGDSGGNEGRSTPVSGGPPGPFQVMAEEGQLVEAIEGRTITLSWAEAARAQAYDVELNGVIVAEGMTAREMKVGFVHAGVGFQEGFNTYRVRARNKSGEVWSETATFEVITTGGIRARHFDHEDDGDIPLTVDSSGAALTVGSRFAFGGNGKGVALRSFNPANTRAYKNHLQLPVRECWVRVAVRLEAWERDNVNINLARIRSTTGRVNEQLIWRTGVGLHSTSISQDFQMPPGEWFQAQLGVRDDGTVELWIFDGHRELLVGRGQNEGLIGQVKDIVSLGNDSPSRAITYEVWLDEFAVGEQRLPWARINDRRALPRPKPLDPSALPSIFSFVFGSCNVSSRVPYSGTALEAAAAMEPDFVIHLGDYCYPDTGAYTQSKQGYLALWTDMLYEERLNRLFNRPWIYVASDHDMGGNNVDSESLAPFALEAFNTWHSNDPTVDGEGRYGAVAFDESRVLLIWLDAISFRSPISQPDGPGKTALGTAQKKWFLDLLASSSAGLVIIASQTAFGHDSDTGWGQYTTERLELVEACQHARGIVRWVSGDHHSARWARIGDRVAEWGAAPFAEVPQGCPGPAPFVESAVCISRAALIEIEEVLTRTEILSDLTQDEINKSTSFGRVVIDTIKKTATFDVRDNLGNIRADSSGFRLMETIKYA